MSTTICKINHKPNGRLAVQRHEKMTLVFNINNIYLSTQQITATKQMLTTLWQVIIPTTPERGGGGEEGSLHQNGCWLIEFQWGCTQ